MSETSTPPLRTNKATVHYLFSVRNMFPLLGGVLAPFHLLDPFRESGWLILFLHMKIPENESVCRDHFANVLAKH